MGLQGSAQERVLIADSDIHVRSAIAHYLRTCGYKVLEAATSDEAMKAVEPDPLIKFVLCDVDVSGSFSGFELKGWIGTKRADINVMLSAGLVRAAQNAASLCDCGPCAARPYPPEMLVDRIKRQKAAS